MKRVLVAGSMLFLLSGPALAQQQDYGQQDQQRFEQDRQQQQRFQDQQRIQQDRQQPQRYQQDRMQQDRMQRGAQGQVRPLSDITGANVETARGENLGSIRDVAIDEQDGSIVYAVLARGGFLGIGRNLYAVPWEALQPDHRQRRLEFTLDISEDQLDRMDGFDDRNWPAQPDHRLTGGRQQLDQRDQERLHMQRRDEGEGDRQRQAWQLERRDQFDQPREQYRFEVERRDRDDQWQRDRQTQDQRQQDRFRDDRTTWRDDRTTSGRDDTTWRGRRDARRTPAGIVRGSSVLGYEVINPRGEDLGRVDDVMVELDNGRIAYVVMAAGGFLRVGEDYYPLSWRNVQVREQQRALVANIDSRQLEQAEGFDRNELVDIRDARQARRFQEMQILGEPVGPEHRQARPGQTEADRRYHQRFDEDRIHSIRGQITSVTEMSPMPQASRIIVMRVRGEDDRTYVVHLAPSHFIEQRDMNLRTGSQVEVRGSWVQVQDQSVLMASEVRADGQTLRLRERDGTPAWERHERDRDRQGQQRFRQERQERQDQQR